MFRLDVRKKFIHLRTEGHWNRLPREVVDAPSLEMFDAGLEESRGSLIWWVALLTAGC